MLTYDDIIKEDNEDIYKDCEPVKLPLSKEDIKTLEDMHEYLIKGYEPDAWKKYRIKPGVGLAAPQIDVLKRMFCVLAYDERGDLWDFGVVNPKIISHSTQLIYLPMGEGCLSVDRETEGFVHRARKVKVSFHLYDFETKTLRKVVMRLKDYVAIIFQHELDHLSGTLFVSRINKDNPFFVPENSKPLKLEYKKDF